MLLMIHAIERCHAPEAVHLIVVSSSACTPSSYSTVVRMSMQTKLGNAQGHVKVLDEGFGEASPPRESFL